MQTPEPITMDRLYELCAFAKVGINNPVVCISPKELWALVEMAKQTLEEPGSFNKLNDLLGKYWDAAYAEGKEGRSHDTRDAVAQRTLEAINTEVQKLERLREALSDALIYAEEGVPVPKERSDKWKNILKGVLTDEGG